MTITIDSLPITTECVAKNARDVVDAVREAAGSGRAVYPLGGRTALDFGLAPTAEGVGLLTTGLDRVVEYDPRDLTVTVEAGMTFSQLARTLAAEDQELPLDVPRATEATLGGVVATNWSGPRRYGRGTLRDYLIGISAVDGRGVAFKSGGRVMKNVAGYDFAKLLTGSLGTLAVITQLTFKVRPTAENSAMMSCSLRDWDHADEILAAMNESSASPSAIELLGGTARQISFLGKGSAGHQRAAPRKSAGYSVENGDLATLVVFLDGNAAEIASMHDALVAEWNRIGANSLNFHSDDEVTRLFQKLSEFPDSGLCDQDCDSPLVIKIAVKPSQVTKMCQSVLEIDPIASIVSHVGNGIILVRFTELSAGEISGALVGTLRPAATSCGGSLVVLRSEYGGLTPQVIWGGRTNAHQWLQEVKQKFDPQNILNPGRLSIG